MIGIFDSGSGGLTVLKEIRRLLPKADIVYVGDIKNIPYGTKSQDDLKKLTMNLINILVANGANKIVSACNSISATVLAVAPLNLIEMVGPTVRNLKNSNKEIYLAATPATIESGIYQKEFLKAGKKIESIAVKSLAGLIESGADDQEIEKSVEEIKKQVMTDDDRGKKLLILGCTHYPLVQEIFERIFDKTGTKVYNPAIAVAQEVKKKMSEDGSGGEILLITKESKVFREHAEKLMGRQLEIKLI